MTLLEALQSVFVMPDGTAYCCDANYHKSISPGDVGNCRRVQIIEFMGDDMGDNSTIIPCISSLQAHATVNDDLCPALTAAAGMGGGQTAMVLDPPEINVIGSLGTIGTTSEHNNRVHDPDGISPTVTAVAGGTHHVKIFDYSRFRVRRLTPTEYGRLQGFPMETWRQVVSDTQAYKQFGNAVTTTVAKAIAESLTAFLRGENTC